MRLQGLILDDGAPQSLFVRGGSQGSGAVSIKAGCSASFDTYYNSFSYTKYRRFTRVSSIEFRLEICGCAEISLCVYDTSEHIICCASQTSGSVSLTAELSKLPENGFMYARVNAETDCRIMSAEYHTAAKPDDISACAVICTYQREEFVYRSIERFRRGGFSFLNRVFVIDNGNTIDASKISDGFVTVLPNRNLGGSGGFARGLLEARRSGYTHVILMDDDIDCYAETLERMTALVSLLKRDYSESWLSAAMIPLDNPTRQYEMGAEWKNGKAKVHKQNVDITDRDTLLDNLNNPGVNYGGWWTLLMPLSVTDSGLPLPLFIKFDDVEYGLRRRAETEIITMNGIAVRHEAFDKKTSFVLDYYNLRNELVMEAVRGNLTLCRALKRFWREVLKECMLYRYDCCRLVFRAIEDFLCGANLLMERSGEEINKELIKAAPAMKPLSEIPEWSEELRCDDTIKDTRISLLYALTVGGHLLPPFLPDGKVTALPASRVGAANIFRRKTVIQYQLGGNIGIVTRRCLPKAVGAIFRAGLLSFRLIFGYGRAQKNFVDNADRLCSEEAWEARLGLELSQQKIRTDNSY